MKMIIATAAVSALALAATPAAAEGLYGQLNAGISLESKVDITVSDGSDSESADFDLDTGGLIGGAVGSQLGPVRGEAELFYTQNDIEDSDLVFDDTVEVKSWALMANVIYDIPMGTQFTPYVGAGVGYGETTAEIDGEDESDTGTVWQVKVGGVFHGDDGMALDVGYRYIRLADWEIGDDTGSIDAETELHVFAVGVRFPLGPMFSE